MISGACTLARSIQNLKESMHIDRKASTVLMVIDRIYQPIAQSLGVSLLLRNEIITEIQFSPRFFINLIQITGNLVANAIKFTSPNGLVDVVFKMDKENDYRTLNIIVTDTGNTIPPDLVSAFNKSKKVAKLMEADKEDSFGTRLNYVMQLVSEESGRIYLNSGKDFGTTFSLSLPLPQRYLHRKNGFYPIIKNGTTFLENSLN